MQCSVAGRDCYCTEPEVDVTVLSLASQQVRMDPQMVDPPAADFQCGYDELLGFDATYWSLVTFQEEELRDNSMRAERDVKSDAAPLSSQDSQGIPVLQPQEQPQRLAEAPEAPVVYFRTRDSLEKIFEMHGVWLDPSRPPPRACSCSI